MVGLFELIFRILQGLVLARVVISWVPQWRYTPAGRWIAQTVDPALRPFQRLLPPWKTGGLDFSPFFALIVLEILRAIILGLL